MVRRERIKPDAKMMEMERVKELSQQMVHHFLRRAEYRRSDVGLDVGVIYKPDSAPRTSVDPAMGVDGGDAYPFKTAECINILQLRAIHHALQWRARSSLTPKANDSYMCRIRRFAWLLWSWVESRLNPADEPSRRFEKKKEDAV